MLREMSAKQTEGFLFLEKKAVERSETDEVEYCHYIKIIYCNIFHGALHLHLIRRLRRHLLLEEKAFFASPKGKAYFCLKPS